MKQVCVDLGISVDVDRLIGDMDHILTVANWESNQIALQYASEESWTDGIGKSDHLLNDEQQYTHYHSALDGLYIKEVLTGMNFPVSHARLMNLPPKTCYTTHIDYYTRYHIPLTTRPLQTFMIFPDFEPSVARMPAGSIYWSNTHELHNFVNGTTQSRVHIVFNDATEDKYLDSNYLDS